MPRDGTKNLIPQNQRTKEEQRKIAQKGGKKSGEVRRERKLLKDELLSLLSDGDNQEKMCLAIVRQAQRGNIKAFEVVRDTIGEKPVESFEPLREIEDDPLSASLKDLAGELDAD